jgi:hypothetical protein
MTAEAGQWAAWLAERRQAGDQEELRRRRQLEFLAPIRDRVLANAALAPESGCWTWAVATPKVRAIASISFICGLAACPFRSFPDCGVRDPLARGPLDQVRNLGVAVTAAVGRPRHIDEPVHFVRQGAQGRLRFRAPVLSSDIATPPSTISAAGQGSGVPNWSGSADSQLFRRLAAGERP